MAAGLDEAMGVDADAASATDGVGWGEAEKPAGVAAFSEKMKSSMFMASPPLVLYSDVLRSCAMPLGAFWVAGRASLLQVLMVSALSRISSCSGAAYPLSISRVR